MVPTLAIIGALMQVREPVMAVLGQVNAEIYFRMVVEMQ